MLGRMRPLDGVIGLVAVALAFGLGGCPYYKFPQHQVQGRTTIVALVGPQAPVEASQSVPITVWYYDPDGPATSLARATIDNTTAVPIQGNAVTPRLDGGIGQASAPVETLVRRDPHTYTVSQVQVTDYVMDGGQAFHSLVVHFVPEATGTITLEAAGAPGFDWTESRRQIFERQSSLPASAATTRLQFEVR